MKNICVFEDETWACFAPLTLTRPVYDLVCGMSSLQEKVFDAYGDCQRFLACRPSQTAVVRERHPRIAVNISPEGPSLWVNGRVLADETLPLQIPYDGEEAAFLCDDTVVAIRIHDHHPFRPDLSVPAVQWVSHLSRQIQVDVPLVTYPWELVQRNPECLERDFAGQALGGRIAGHISDGARCAGRERICVEAGAQIKAGAVLDAERGPIYVAGNAVVGANAVIEGPATIGPGTLVRPLTRISQGVSLGPHCKVGGEIQQSIIQGFSNKQHDGYLGHSYLGSWVNLGAGTTNSDLKNNYHTVRVSVGGRPIDTGSIFVGLTMGDHSKTGIGTLFGTGAVVGVSSNIFGSGLAPRFIPSFLWGGSGGFAEQDLASALATARAVMARREQKCSEAESQLLTHIFDTTSQERRAFLQSPVS